MERLILENHEIKLYCGAERSAPLVICHYVDDGEALIKACRRLGCGDFTLALIRNLEDVDEMSPYKVEALKQFRGMAEEYIKILTAGIIPQIEKKLQEKPKECLLAGYSLAGLFSVYAMYHTTLFSKIISCSGSLWYPGFVNYVKERKLAYKPEKIYFSVGRSEKNTRNRLYRNVEACTLEIEEFFAAQKLQTVFELNEGGHFQDIGLRMAKGIKWALE